MNAAVRRRGDHVTDRRQATGDGDGADLKAIMRRLKMLIVNMKKNSVNKFVANEMLQN